MSVQQSVDWSTDEAQAILRRMHRSYGLRHKLLVLLLFLVLLALGVARTLIFHQPLILILTVLLMVGLAYWMNAAVQGSLRAARASGLTHYHLEEAEPVIHIRNDLGEFRIAFAEIDRISVLPGRLLVNYAGQSQMTLPDGPVASELQRRLNSSPAQKERR